MKRLLNTLIAALMVCVLCILTASALTLIDKDKPASLTINYVHTENEGKTPISGAHFSLYRIADVAESGALTLTEKFASYAETITNLGNMSDLTTEQWQALADDLKAVVLSADMSADAEGDTDKDGALVFPDAAQGMYLVISDDCTCGGWKYTCVPTLVLLPGRDDIEWEWYYDVTISPKHSREKEDIPGGDEKFIRITVTKIWDDESDASLRPEEITVHLYHGRREYDEVKLSEENRWTYTWEHLVYGGDWFVTEDKVEGYTSSSERFGDTFVLTNSRHITPPDDNPPEDNPPEEYPPEENPPEDNPPEDNPPKDNPPENPPSDEPEEKLPQTGVLWWPVPVMFVLGFIFVIAGKEMRKRNESGI